MARSTNRREDHQGRTVAVGGVYPAGGPDALVAIRWARMKQVPKPGKRWDNLKADFKAWNPAKRPRIAVFRNQQRILTRLDEL